MRHYGVSQCLMVSCSVSVSHGVLGSLMLFHSVSQCLCFCAVSCFVRMVFHDMMSHYGSS